MLLSRRAIPKNRHLDAQGSHPIWGQAGMRMEMSIKDYALFTIRATARLSLVSDIRDRSMA
jgi:hypothetical protein